MTDLFDTSEGATPLEPEERDGLRQSWITTRADLNVAEQDNIDKGVAWVIRLRTPNFLSVRFALELHRRMFGDVWDWAGTYRRTERNIGIAPHRIGAEMPNLLGDISYWTEHSTYSPVEIAVRLHHRLVYIHPFPNGNGRHARFMADLLLERLGGAPLTWGGASLSNIGDLRRTYVAALRKADRDDYGDLIAFAQS